MIQIDDISKSILKSLGDAYVSHRNNLTLYPSGDYENFFLKNIDTGEYIKDKFNIRTESATLYYELKIQFSKNYTRTQSIVQKYSKIYNKDIIGMIFSYINDKINVTICLEILNDTVNICCLCISCYVDGFVDFKNIKYIFELCYRKYKLSISHYNKNIDLFHEKIKYERLAITWLRQSTADDLAIFFNKFMNDYYSNSQPFKNI